MTGFQAWHLPSAFEPREGEIREGRTPGASPAAFLFLDLSHKRLGQLAAVLGEARCHGLLRIPVGRIVERVDEIAGRLETPGDPLRLEALEALVAFAGYSNPMAEAVLDGMARGWRRESLWTLLRSEFDDPASLDGFVKTRTGEQTRALGYPLTFHLGAGTVPGVAVTSLVRALLVKSAVLLKPGLGDLALPVLFARALARLDPDMGESLAVTYWPGGELETTEKALRHGDLVVAYGSDETVDWVGRNLPPHVPLRAYRHRMGLGLIGRHALGRGQGAGGARSTARAAAGAAALFDQKGCVSPHVFLVEEGGQVSPEGWCPLLAEAFRSQEVELPGGHLSKDEAVELQQLRGDAEMAEGLGEGRVYHDGGASSWTVIFRPEEGVRPSCLNRVVRVLPVPSLQEALSLLEPWAPHLQTVGLAVGEDPSPEILEGLARLGVSRIASLGRVPWPEAWWHHDGTGPLLDLVRWTDTELG